MNLTTVQWEILGMSCEDAYPLWGGILAGVRSLYPTRSEDEATRIAIEAAVSLLARGLVEVSWFTHETSEEERIDAGLARDILQNTTSWQPQEGDGPYLTILTTDEGTALWERTPRPEDTE